MRKESSTNPYRKSRASRQQVLDAAIQTIAKQGFAQTSVQDIADAAKLSKGAVHYHFENKDDLIKCVLEQCCEHLSTRVKAAWEAPGSPTDRIRRAIDEMWIARKERGPELRVISDLMAQGVHDEALREPLAQMFRKNREEILEQGIRGLLSMGLKPKVAAEAIPRLLLGALDGMALHAVFDPPTPGDESETLRALELIALALFEL
jgi:AcrR family transcriptional regulator